MLLRLATAAVLIPIVVALVWWAPPIALAGVAAIVAILALMEFLNLGDRIGLRGFKLWTYFCTVLVFYAQFSLGRVETHALSASLSMVRDAAGGTLSIEAALLVFLFGSVVLGLLTKRPLHDVLPAIAIDSAALLFIVLPFSYIVRLDEIEPVGRQLVLFTLVLVWAGDMLAYLVGKSLGRVPMAPALSPKKNLGRRPGQRPRLDDRGRPVREMDADRRNHTARDSRNRKHSRPSRRPDRIRLQTRRSSKRFRRPTPRPRRHARPHRQPDPGQPGRLAPLPMASPPPISESSG
jgi:CDP-diglyceride synthetase